MSRRSRSDRQQIPASFRAGNRSRFQQVLLGSTAALLVAEPLVPDEPSNLGNGLALAMLWLLLLCAWLTSQLKRHHLVVRWSATDRWLAALFVVFNLGLLAAAWSERIGMRPAFNALFAWTRILVAYFLFRQVIDTGRAARAMIAVMLSMVAATSSFGLYQYFVALPELRAEYEQNPQRMLAKVGIGPELQQTYEQRVMSSEPFGTFALANSFAGFLAPWLVLLIGMVMMGGTAMRQGSTWAAVAGGGLALAVCLLLTKSRTAYVAVAVGVVLMWLVCRREHRRAGLLLCTVGGVTGILLLAVVAVGGVDLPVVTEAWRSLSFRFEYWRATLGMIADYPLFGSGLGNFGDYYTVYKLPQASEEIADPHNFLFEVWATGGTLAAVCLLAALGTWLTRVRRATPQDTWPATDMDPTRPVALGSVCGLGVGWFAGTVAGYPPDGYALLFGLILLPLGALVLRPWVLEGTLPAGALAVAAVVVLVHLLGAGGISFPGVATGMWLLVALSLNTVEAHEPRREWSNGSAWGALAVAVALTIACYTQGYLPVTTSRAALDAALQAARDRPGEYLPQLESAYGADPYAYQPAGHLAGYYFQRWMQRPNPADLAEFERYKDAMLQRGGHSWTVWEQAANWYDQAHQLRPTAGFAEKSVAAHRRTAELYPHSAKVRGELALALAAAGQTESARREAQTALALDAEMPHADKQLPHELRAALKRIALQTD